MSSVAASPIASGTTFAQLQAGGLDAVIDNLVATNVAIADPSTQATVAVTGGGATLGLLAAGAYFLTYSWSNGFGETLAGGRSATFTVAAGNKPRVTIPALPTGAVSANIYLTPAGGASGTETLYLTGVTGLTADLLLAAIPGWAAGGMPVANTTALAKHPYFYTGKHGRLQDVYNAARQDIDNYLHGDPIKLAEAKSRLARTAAIFSALTAALNEVAVLVDANPGTVGNVSTPIGNPKVKRAFP